MTQDRVRNSTKLAFGIGQVAEGIKNNAFSTFLLLYYNQVLGLSGTLSGLAIMIALCFDAITDPLAGSLSDGWRSRWGRRHPFMYASALPLGIAFYLLFAPPAGLTEFETFLWLTVFAVLTRGAMTLYHVPHLALGAELSDDYAERTSIVSYRMLFGVLGGALTILIGFSVFFTDQGGLPGTLRRDAYPAFAAVFSVAMVVTILWSALGTHDQIPRLKTVAAREAPDGREGTLLRVFLQVFFDLKSALTNRSFRWLFSGVIIVYVMVGVQSALGLYMGNYFWALSSDDFRWVVLAGPLGLILGTPFTHRMNQRFDKMPSVVFGTAWYALFALSPPILRLLGWFPENDHPALLPLLVGAALIGGMGVVQALITAGSMMADIADEHELATRRRQEGIFFGALSFSGKGASGIGNLVGGFGLDVIAFPAKAIPGEVPLEVLTRLGWLYGPLVAGFALIAVWCYSHYNLTKARHSAVLEALEARRQGTPSAD